MTAARSLVSSPARSSWPRLAGSHGSQAGRPPLSAHTATAVTATDEGSGRRAPARASRPAPVRPLPRSGRARSSLRPAAAPPPEHPGQLPSGRCLDRVERAAACVRPPAAMPRNSRTSRQSTSAPAGSRTEPRQAPSSSCRPSTAAQVRSTSCSASGTRLARLRGHLERPGYCRVAATASELATTRTFCAPPPARWASTARAASRPLRTAPSIVSGIPVSVHAPATAKPARPVP
jgi:hypothetical protein